MNFIFHVADPSLGVARKMAEEGEVVTEVVTSEVVPVAAEISIQYVQNSYYIIIITIIINNRQSKERKGRKRTRNPDKWHSKHVKKRGLRSNAPCEITSCCKKNCLQSFSVEHLQKLKNDFQQLYYDQQNICLCGLLHRFKTKKTSGHRHNSNPCTTINGKRRGRPGAEDSAFSFKYHVVDQEGINTTVCQKAFCNIHGFTSKRLQVLRKKIVSGIPFDERGKHRSHQKVSDDIRNLVRDHISSLPARTSHYSRKHNSARKYLPPELSIARLYKDFLKIHDPDYLKLEEENYQREVSHQPLQKIRKPIISEHFYHDIFVKEFNIGFGYPRTDTCCTCDYLKVSFDCAIDDKAKKELEEELKTHQL